MGGLASNNGVVSILTTFIFIHLTLLRCQVVAGASTPPVLTVLFMQVKARSFTQPNQNQSNQPNHQCSQINRHLT